MWIQLKKDPFKYYFQNKENKKVKWEEDKVYVDALYQGYLDACRTFKWEKDGKDNKEYIREIFEEKENRERIYSTDKAKR